MGTRIVDKVNMGSYQLKGVHITGKPHMYKGTSGYPTKTYRGMEIPYANTELNYGVGITGSGWIPGKYRTVEGDVEVIRQPMFPIRWSTAQRYDTFVGEYEGYALQADKWRTEHGVPVDTPAKTPQQVIDVINVGKGPVVYSGDVVQYTRVTPTQATKDIVREDPSFRLGTDMVDVGIHADMQKQFTGGEILSDTGFAGSDLSGSDKLAEKFGTVGLIALAVILALGAIMIGRRKK